MESDKEENEMVFLTMNEQYILDEQAARRIISTSPIKLPKSNEFNDLCKILCIHPLPFLWLLYG